jgi:integrase
MVERQNYLLVQAHLRYLQDIYQLSPASLDRYRFYLRHLILWADSRLFRDAHSFRPTFPAYVANLNGRSGSPLTQQTQKKIIDVSKRFFVWAKTNDPKEFGRLPNDWIASLRVPRTPHHHREHVFVTVDEVIALTKLPVSDDDLALRRDQAAAAMLFLSGMRISAFTSMPISALNLADRSVRQWPELGVLTKNTKRATTYLLPIPELLAVVRTWDESVRSKLPATARWYTPIEHTWGDQRLSTKDPGKNRHQTLDKRLRRLFELTGLPYKSAHKFRHGHAVYGLQSAQTMADYKAVSMNLMHHDIEITDSIYAPILSDEVKERIAGLSSNSSNLADDELAGMIRGLSNMELSKVMMIIARRLEG